MANELYRWNFHTKHERGHLWYIIALACVVGLVIWGFLTSQYGMSFVVMLLAGVTFFIENNSEDSVEIVVTELGMSIGSNFYDFSKITSFCFLYDGPVARVLRLRVNKKTLPVLDLDINNDMVTELKSVLVNYVKEDEKGEFSFTDKLIHFLKL